MKYIPIFIFNLFAIAGMAIYGYPGFSTIIKVILIISLLINISRNKYFYREVPIYVSVIILIYTCFLLLSNIIDHESVDFNQNVLNLIIGPLCFFYILEVGKNEFDFFLKSIHVVVLINFVFLLIQFFDQGLFDALFASLLKQNSSDNYHVVFQRYPSVWLEAPRLAAMMGVLLPFCLPNYLNLKWKYLSPILIFVIILITQSRASLITAILGLLYYNEFKIFKPKMILIYLVCFIIYSNIESFGINLSRLAEFNKEIEYGDYSYTNRGDVFKIGLSLIILHPIEMIFGLGQSYMKYMPPGFSSFHNFILQSIIQNGFITTILFLTIMIMTIVQYKRDRNLTKINLYNNYNRKPEYKLFTKINNMKKSLKIKSVSKIGFISMISIIIPSFFHGLMFDLQLSMFFWISIGVVYKFSRYRTII